MNLITFVGFAAGTLTTVAFLPQLIQTWKSKSAKDISGEWLVIFSSGVFLWLVYGLLIQSPPVILTNSVTLALTSIILVFKFKFR